MIRKASAHDIACEYADDLNTLKSDEITVKAGLKAWRGEWKCVLANRTMHDTGCPQRAYEIR